MKISLHYEISLTNLLVQSKMNRQILESSQLVYLWGCHIGSALALMQRFQHVAPILKVPCAGSQSPGARQILCLVAVRSESAPNWRRDATHFTQQCCRRPSAAAGCFMPHYRHRPTEYPSTPCPSTSTFGLKKTNKSCSKRKTLFASFGDFSAPQKFHSFHGISVAFSIRFFGTQNCFRFVANNKF